MPSSSCCALSSGIRWAAGAPSPGDSSRRRGRAARRPRLHPAGRRPPGPRVRAGPAGPRGRRPAALLRHLRFAPAQDSPTPGRNAERIRLTHPRRATRDLRPLSPTDRPALHGTFGPTPPGHLPRRPGSRDCCRGARRAPVPASAGDHKWRREFVGDNGRIRGMRGGWQQPLPEMPAPPPARAWRRLDAPRGVRAAMAAAGRGRPGAGARPRVTGRDRPGSAGGGPRLEAGHGRAVQQGRPLRRRSPCPRYGRRSRIRRSWICGRWHRCAARTRSTCAPSPGARSRWAGRRRWGSSGRCAATRCTPRRGGCWSPPTTASGRCPGR